MPKRKQSPTKNKILAAQVREYIDRYHPEFGEVDIEIDPAQRIATVRDKRTPRRKR